jgi:hypothetical protein
MDKVVSQIQKHSKANTLQQLKEYLKGEEKELARQKQHISEALQALDPVLNSLGILYLM